MAVVLELPVFTRVHLQMEILNVDTWLQAYIPWQTVVPVQMAASSLSRGLSVIGWMESIYCVEKSLIDS